jgi:hypothetical protein
VDTTGLDVAKLKALVIEKWRSGSELWPVKVVPLARLAGLEQKNHGKPVETAGGYFTCLRPIRGKTPAEMELILGFARGYYSSGAGIFKFLSLPAADQFELRAYTQLPAGNPCDGIVVRSLGERPEFSTTAANRRYSFTGSVSSNGNCGVGWFCR